MLYVGRFAFLIFVDHKGSASRQRPTTNNVAQPGVPTMPNDALRLLLPIASWSEERTRAVEITGGTDPILPTPFRIGETCTAALAALGLAVSDLWELRTGRCQNVAVDTRQAIASLRSGHYLKLDG